MKRQKKLKRRLQWEYCECGCKGFDIQVAGKYFWCFINLQTGKWLLTSGHGACGIWIGKFDSGEEVDEKILELLKADGLLDKLREDVKILEELLEDNE